MICFAKKAEAALKHIDSWITKDNGDGVAARIVEAILTSIELLERFRNLDGKAAAQERANWQFPEPPILSSTA